MGKTAVFTLGVLDQIKVPGPPLQALVLCHTRELAHQIAKEFDRLGKFLEGLKIQTIYGGVNEQAQILKLKNEPPQVVIGTPGRTLALIRKKKLVFDSLKFFVLDECDKILERYGMYFFIGL
jgi:superfamily II DNA/RNA helicase